MIKKTSGMLSVLLFLFLGSTANPAFSAPLYECPFKGSGGDRIDHAFYLENYSSSTLGRVTLGFYTLVPGQFTIALDAREDTFDGTLIKTVSQTVDLNTSPNLLLVDFDFENSPVASDIVTFKIRITSGSGSVHFDIGTGPCTDVVKTEDSTPPLSTPRFNSVGVTVYATSGYTVGGTVTGLTAGSDGVWLRNNGDDTTDILKVTNGGFTFPEQIDGSSYSVTVPRQPTGQTCNVTNGRGTITGADVTNVAVVCVTNPTVGGTVTGLTAGSDGVTLRNNGDNTTDILKVTNGGFTFPPQYYRSNYSVTVPAQPTGQTCTISNGVGTDITADVTNVSVDCAGNSVKPIPTLSEWALILLSMLLGVVVFARAGRQQA